MQKGVDMNVLIRRSQTFTDFLFFKKNTFYKFNMFLVISPNYVKGFNLSTILTQNSNLYLDEIFK